MKASSGRCGSLSAVFPVKLLARTMPAGNRYFVKLFLLLLFVLQATYPVFSQNDYKSEKELKSQAEKFFKEEDYPSAMPLYSQLLSLYPADPNFNYKFGVCLLYATEDKEKPISFLKLAVGKEEVDEDVYYHLGRAYHLNYRFAEALAQYEEFKKRSSGKTNSRLEVDRQIEMCRNGQNLLKNITDLVVMEKKTLNESEYFRAYDLTKVDAKLVVKPEDLMTSADKKKKDKSTIVVRQTSSEIYFSSYGEDGKNRDIYKTSRLPNFTWTKPENLGGMINTPYDEDFPYITPNGKTLYFSSKGHNSMGGYDVFRSQWDAVANAWGKPVNLDFAVNTPDDDIQYIPDAQEVYAYFSSRRSVPSGKITVYRISTTRVPPSIALVRGQFMRDSPNDPLPKIIIKSAETKKQVGTYKPKSSDALYRVNLGIGNRYEYSVEFLGMPPYVQMVDIPEMKEERPLRQEIRIKKSAGGETMEILTFFADTANDEGSQLARAEWLKAKAGLDVNADALQEGSSANLVKNEKKKFNVEFVEAESPGLSNTRLVEIANEDAAEAAKEAQEAKTRAGRAFAYANKKAFTAKEKYNQADNISRQAAAANDPSSSGSLFSEAERKKAEAVNAAIEARAAFSLALSLEKDASLKKQEAAQAADYASRVDKAVRSNDRQELNKLTEETVREQEAAPAVAESDSLAQQKEIASRQTLIAKLKESNFQIENELAEDNQELSRMNEALAAAKGDKKTPIQQQIAEIESGKNAKKREQAANNLKIQKYQNEVDLVLAEEKISREWNAELEKSSLPELDDQERQALQAQVSELQRKMESEPVLATNSSGLAKAENKNASGAIAQQENQSPGVVPNLPEKTEAPASQNPAAKTQESLLSEMKQSSPGTSAATAKKLDARADSITAVLSNETDEAKIAVLYEEVKQLREQAVLKRVVAKSGEFSVDNEKNIAMSDVLNDKEKSLRSEGKVAQALELKKELEDIQRDLDKSREIRGSVVPSLPAKKQDSLIAVSLGLQKRAMKAQEELIRQNGVGMPAVLTASGQTREPFNAEQATLNAAKATSATAAVEGVFQPAEYETSLELLPSAIDSVRSSEPFIKFDDLLSKSDTLLEKAREQAKRSDELGEEGKRKLGESQSMIELASAEGSKRKKEAMIEEAIRMDNEGKREMSESESLRKLAVSNAVKAASIQEQANQYLKGMPQEQRDRIVAALEDVKPEPALAINPGSGLEGQKNQNPDANKNALNSSAETGASSSSGQVASAGNAAAGNKQAEQPVLAENPDSVRTAEGRSVSGLVPTEGREGALTLNNAGAGSGKQDGNASSSAKQPSVSSSVNTEMKEVSVASTEEKGSANEMSVSIPQESGSEESRKPEVFWAETRKEPEYLEYSGLKNQSAQSKKQGELFKAQSDSLRKEADEISQRTTDLLEFAAAQGNKKKQKQASAQAVEFDREAKEKKRMSDSLSTLSGLKFYESVQFLKKADTYFQALPAEKGRAYRMSFENIVPDVPIAQAQNVSASENKSAEIAINKANPEKTPSSVEANVKKTSQQSGGAVSPKTGSSEGSVSEGTAKSNTAAVEMNSKKATQKSETSSPVKGDASAGVAQAQGSPKAVNNGKAQAEKKNTGAENEAKENAAQSGTSAVLVQEEKKGPSAEEIKSTPTYKQYESAMNEVAVLKSQAQPSRREADFARAEADTLFKQYNSKLEQAAGEKKKERKRLVEEAKVLQAMEIDSRRRADSLLANAGNRESEVRKKEEEAAGILSVLDSRTASQIKDVYAGVYVQEVIRTEVAVAAAPENREKAAASQASPQPRSVETRFSSSGGSYGSGNKIPIDPVLPSGIVYKVQIGAFNRQVADNAFGGITPVSGESKGNLIRYTAGLFKAFTEASSARQTLNGIGFGDAFVVAYCNGQRISITKAREFERSGADCASEGIAANRPAPNSSKVSTDSDSGNKEQGVSPANTQMAVQEPRVIAPGATLPQKGFEVVKGLVYTVQVGVYSRPVTAGQLFNIQPLYFDRTGKGLYRYSTGVYNNIPDAVKAKNIAVGIGITDAFVTAYFEGKRISMPEAAAMVSKNGQAVFIDRADMNRMPTQLSISSGAGEGNSSAGKTGLQTTEPTKGQVAERRDAETAASTGTKVSSEVSTSAVESPGNIPVNIEYRVQIGAFRKDVPVEMMNKFLSIAAMGISSGKTEEGLTIYSVGKFRDFAGAEKLKAEVQAQGLSDAFVAPYNNGKRISIEEARRLEK